VAIAPHLGAESPAPHDWEGFNAQRPTRGLGLSRGRTEHGIGGGVSGAPRAPSWHLPCAPRLATPFSTTTSASSTTQGDVEIVVYYRAIPLFTTESEAVRRIHQVCCRLDDIAGS